MFKRIFDVFICLLIFILFFIPFLVIWLTVKFTSAGPGIYWSRRIGKDNKIFMMPKFRTMLTCAPEVPSHRLNRSKKYLTPFGYFLRKTSLDELPQVWSILKGDMSFVGPRPALFNQSDLIELRTLKGIHHLIPGLTGWAQVNGRDDLPIAIKVEFDKEYLKKQSFLFDLKILSITVIKVIRREGISH